MASADIRDDENDLETYLAKATNPLHRQPDPEALSSFCQLVEKEHDGPQTALRLLSHKIQSPIEKESLMALAVLEESVKKCGSKFRSEVGKFRFLNEMIKVVSPKYLGSRASSKVKQKIVELMFIWSMELKLETKIFEAYQMLKRQGVVIEDPVYILDNYEPPPPPAPRPKNAIFEDEEKAQQLQKLLRSRNAEDLQAANRLIKNMVREADRRMELMAKRSTELETVHNNANVLADMLNHYKPGETSEEEKDLMKELFESCERLRPKLFRLAGELDEKDEGLGDILKANDELTIVINSYKKAMGLVNGNENSYKNMPVSSKVETSLLDLGSPEQQPLSRPIDSSLLDDQLLALGLSDSTGKETQEQPTSATQSSVNASNTAVSNSLADLDHLFNTDDQTNIASLKTTFPASKNIMPLSSVTNSVIHSNYSSQVFMSGDSSDAPTLKPLHSSSNTTNSISSQVPVNSSAPVSKGFEELDELGQLLLRKSLPAASSVKLEFPSTPQKVPLSQLKQQQAQQLQSKTQSTLINSTTPSVAPVTKVIPGTISNPLGKMSPARSPAHDVLSLRDIFVPLETVQPGELAPLNLHEKNGLTVVIHFGKDAPRPDITVMVVSTMSKNSSPVKNVSFQAAVPKSMKIRLQPPSATDLPPHNPILPPAAITQVMLLANPQKETVRFKYKVNYKINDEEFTDIGEVDSLLALR